MKMGIAQFPIDDWWANSTPQKYMVIFVGYVCFHRISSSGRMKIEVVAGWEKTNWQEERRKKKISKNSEKYCYFYYTYYCFSCSLASHIRIKLNPRLAVSAAAAAAAAIAPEPHTHSPRHSGHAVHVWVCVCVCSLCAVRCDDDHESWTIYIL